LRLKSELGLMVRFVAEVPQYVKDSGCVKGRDGCNTEDWWTEARKRAPKCLRRDFDTTTILIHWRIWKERNARIFQHEACRVDRVFELIMEDILSWKAAGCIIAF
jgi:hypothetical protein